MTEYSFYIDPGKIYFLKFILEGYDGLAILTTVNKELGLINIKVTRGEEKQFEDLISSMGTELNMVRCK